MDYTTNVAKLRLNRDESYINSPKWLRDKYTTQNPTNNDERCFQYPVTTALHHEII